MVHTCKGNVALLFPTYPCTTWLWIDKTLGVLDVPLIVSTVMIKYVLFASEQNN